MYGYILHVSRKFILGLMSLLFLFEVLSGCSGSSSGSLNSDAPPAAEAPKLLAIAPLTKTVALSGTLNFEASGGTEPYSFDVYYGNGSVTSSGTIGTYQAPNSQGTAVVRVQDANSNTGYATVEIIDAPVIQPTSKVLAVNNKFPFAVLSGKAPYTFSIASGEGTINASSGEFTAGANAGTVIVRVTDADARTSEATVTVNPALNFTTKTVYVEKTATSTLTATGGVPPYSYVMASGAGSVDKTTGIFTASNSLGVSTVHVFDSLGNVDLAVVNITTALSINPSTALIAKNSSLTFSAIGGVPPYTFTVEAGGVGAIVSATGVYTAPTSAGSATVRVTDSLGHTSDSTVSITNNLSFSVANLILAAGNTFDISTIVNGGVTPLAYSVPNSQGLFSGSTYTAPNTPGAYTITVYDSQTPTANSVTTSVLVNSALVLLPATATVAVSTQKSFSAAGGVPPYTYSIQSGGGSITDGLYSAPSVSGSAVLLVTDVRGNTATASVTIQAALAIVPASKTLSAGESFTFTASGGNTPYTFSLLSGSGAINSSSGLYTAPGSSGLATVRAEDAAGNRKDALITILNPLSISPPTISLIKNGAITFTASGGAGPYSFSIASGEGSVNATTGVFNAPAAVGTSTVRVTDSLGAIKDATVTIYDGLTISPFTKSLAVNQTFTFTANGGVAPYTYFLVSGVGSVSSAGAYSSSTAGAAIVRVSDSSGNTSDATISVSSVLAINPTSKTLSVNNTYTFSATGGVPPYAFSKVSGNGTITTAGDYTAPAASTSAVVRVTDADGTTADATITVNDALTISPANVTLAAGGTQSFIAAGGVGPYVYTVISGGGSFANDVYTAPSIASGVSVAVITTDSLGNTASAVITIAPITVTISSPNSSDAITNTNKAAFAVSGTCSEASQAVSVTATDGTTTTTAATPTCSSGSWSTSLNLTSLSDTTITITATHANVNNVAATPASVTLSKDGTAPTVASVTSSTPNGTYGIGANLSIQIVFSESVVVSGIPTLNLATGRSGAAATYASGGNTNTLTFSYTVVSGDNSSDLDYSSTSALVVTAGTIKDAAGNAQTTPTLPAPGATNSLGANKALVINTAVPGAPSGLTLVTPSTSPSTNQTPVINVAGVASGDTVKLFTDSSCQTTAKATGTATGTTIDLTSLSLTEGSYTFYANRTDSVGNASNCSSANLPYVVDRTTPSITNITSTNANGVYKAGATISMQMQFSEVVTVSGLPQLSLTTNNGSKYASYTSGTGTDTLTFTYTVVSGDNTANLDYTSTAALSLAGGSISDAAGNLLLVPLLPTPGASGSLSANKTIVLDTTAPTKPSALSLNTPSSSPGTVATPIIQVSGVVSGDTVKLFTDTCTTQVSSGTASGTTILLTSSALSAGSYTFYANSTDPVGNISECSSANPTPASVAYVLDLTAAAITNVTAVSNGTYTTGGTFTISVVFSKVVNVTGTPVIALTTGQASQATYSSGSGTDTLVFAYSVASGDNSSDLTYTATNSLTLASGTIKDNAGNDATLTLPTIGASGSLSYNRNIVLDTTAPTAPTITGDGIWMTTTATSPNITFTAGTDAGGSGILKHQIQVVLGSNTATVLKTWADFNTSNTAITGLTLADATLYKVQMKAIDNAGNESSVVTSTDGWTVDATAPTTPASVNDGTTSTSVSSSPSLSWTASTDSTSNINYYEVAIGTSAGGTQVQTWTSVTNVTSATITGLSLTNGSTYYASVRAIDNAGNTSSVGQGDGWLVSVPAADTYFNLVSLLLKGTGVNTAQNNTFIDSSTNAFTVTRNGNPTQGAFSPFSPNGWSWYFNGTSDYVLGPANTTVSQTIGSGNFTIEFWAKSESPINTENTVFTFGCAGSGNCNEGFAVFLDNSTGKIALNIGSAGAGATITFDAGSTPSPNVWNHIAITRSGSTIDLYVNGNKYGTSKTSSVAFNAVGTGDYFSLGGFDSTLDGIAKRLFYKGYLSNLRIVSGAALYTSNFTPSTTQLTTATAGVTQLLTAQSNRFIDNSSNQYALTPGSTPKVQAISPFSPSSPYSVASHGGGARFDGTNNYLAVPHPALGTQDFTIEAWINTWDFGSVPQVIISNVVNSGSSGTQWQLGLQTDGLIKLTGWFPTYISTVNAIKLNSWNHVAVTRSGSTFRIYINGVLDNTTTDTPNFSSTVDLNIGREYFSGTIWNVMHSYLSGLRVSTGTALYTGATYSVPTAPPTAIANTSLLLNFTNSGIYDAHASNVIETLGSAQVTTATSKFGSSSLKFNGTTDYLKIPASPNFEFGTGDFTLEMWVNLNSNASQAIFVKNTGSANYGPIDISLSPGHLFARLSSTGSSYDITTGDVACSFTLSEWHHIALVRNGSNFKLYQDGVGTTIATSSAALYSNPTVGPTIGAYPNPSTFFNGYIDGFRITKGVARYTADFTPPTAAFYEQ